MSNSPALNTHTHTLFLLSLSPSWGTVSWSLASVVVIVGLGMCFSPLKFHAQIVALHKLGLCETAACHLQFDPQLIHQISD